MSLPHLKDADKVDYVVNALIPMLQNDLRNVAEIGCNVHGFGSGPNFTLAMLSMIACETIGVLSAPPGTSTPLATRAFISRVGLLAGDQRYERLAGLLVAFFRNGIGHSFLPKQSAGLQGQTLWNFKCVDYMLDPRNEAEFQALRSLHLTIQQSPPNERRFKVVTKLLALDVSRAIGAFATDLHQGDPAIVGAFSAAFDKWSADNRDVRRSQLTALEQQLLDTPIELF